MRASRVFLGVEVDPERAGALLKLLAEEGRDGDEHIERDEGGRGESGTQRPPGRARRRLVAGAFVVAQLLIGLALLLSATASRSPTRTSAVLASAVSASPATRLAPPPDAATVGASVGSSSTGPVLSPVDDRRRLQATRRGGSPAAGPSVRGDAGLRAPSPRAPQRSKDFIDEL